MSALTSDQVLRPGLRGARGWIARQAMAAVPLGFRILRRLRPILRIGSTYVVTLHDDVREVFGEDRAFAVPYKTNLDIITGGEAFFLGMGDTEAYRSSVAAMRQVMRAEDLPRLGERAEALAEKIVDRSRGRLELVGKLIRPVTFDLLSDYLGVPEPAGGRLDVWATRLFEFQFASSPKDVALLQEVNEIAPAFRAHIDDEIARRKASGAQRDDVLGRCLTLQGRGQLGFGDREIRTGVLCMLVGGPPQPPMVVPQALEQLLRRPNALSKAVAAAEENDDSLRDIVLEAMRFDPLAPGLPRIAIRDWTIARGTRRETMIPKGARVIAAFASAMMDSRRIPSPQHFDPDRRAHEYIHFGHGLHECFGRHINAAILHRMLKPLLRRPNLRRAPGREGHLLKNGPFAERLVVNFD